MEARRGGVLGWGRLSALGVIIGRRFGVRRGRRGGAAQAASIEDGAGIIRVVPLHAMPATGVAAKATRAEVLDGGAESSLAS